MTFEVTQRDKKLLAFLAVVVIGVLFTVFGILPLLDTRPTAWNMVTMLH